MAWGILEPSERVPVPGTALLDDLHKKDHLKVNHDLLKKATGRNSHVVLVPQPSDDPRDPLNWPIWKREMCFFVITLMAGLVGAIGPLLASGYVVIAAEWGDSVNKVAGSNGDLLLGLGCSMFLQSACAVKWGRRPVFLVGALLLFTCCIWSGASKSVGSFTASRVLQGVGMAPYEALVTATIGDLYFVHQRGLRITIWGFAIIGGISIAPIVNGYVVSSDTLGWRWCFWLIVIFFGIGLLGVIFFVPETVYDRAAVYETDEGAQAEDVAKVNQAAHLVEDHMHGTHQESDVEKANEEVAERTLQTAHVRVDFLPAKTFMQELAPWSGYVHPTPYWKIFLRPFPMALSPVVFCGFFIYGMTTAWIVVVSTASALIFGAPPLNLSSKGVGNMSIGTFIAAICGSLVTGPMVDYLTVYASKHNRGIFEPEFRLLLLLPGAIIGVAGYGGWAGMLVGNSVSTWVGPEFMYALIYFGNGLSSTAIVAYIIDIHRKTASEAFTIINFSKNMIIYGFTQFVSNWVVDNIAHLNRVFGILAGLCAICLLTGVPLWIFGKRIRLWISRHPELFSESH